MRLFTAACHTDEQQEKAWLEGNEGWLSLSNRGDNTNIKELKPQRHTHCPVPVRICLQNSHVPLVP